MYYPSGLVIAHLFTHKILYVFFSLDNDVHVPSADESHETLHVSTRRNLVSVLKIIVFVRLLL